jgi:hypothetical protein
VKRNTTFVAVVVVVVVVVPLEPVVESNIVLFFFQYSVLLSMYALRGKTMQRSKVSRWECLLTNEHILDLERSECCVRPKLIDVLIPTLHVSSS